jgi:O-antigen/teichoic acid export membrane protein
LTPEHDCAAVGHPVLVGSQSVQRNTAANAAGLISGSVAGKLASLAMYGAMARLLGRRGFGEFTLALAIAFLLTLDLGLDMVVSRLAARDRREIERGYGSAVMVKAAVAGSGVVVAFGIAAFAPLAPTVRIALALLAPAAGIELIARTNYAVLEGLRDQRPQAWITTAQRVLTAASAVGVMALGGGVAGAAAAYLGGSLFGLLSSTRALLRRVGWLGRQVSGRLARRLLASAAPLAVAAVLETLTMRVDVMLVSHFKGAVAVGLFGAASQLFDGAVFIAWGISSAVYPILGRAADRWAAGSVYTRAIKATNVILFPIGAVLMSVPRPVIDLIYGGAFHSAAIAVRLIGAAIALYGIDFISWTALIARGRAHATPWIVGSWAVINVALNLALVPLYSYRGAAEAFLIGQAAHTVMTVGLTMREVGGVAWLRAVMGPATACLPVVALAVAGAPGVVALTLGIVSYPPLLFAVERALYRDDLDLVREQFLPRRIDAMASRMLPARRTTDR